MWSCLRTAPKSLTKEVELAVYVSCCSSSSVFSPVFHIRQNIILLGNQGKCREMVKRPSGREKYDKHNQCTMGEDRGSGTPVLCRKQLTRQSQYWLITSCLCSSGFKEWFMSQVRIKIGIYKYWIFPANINLKTRT